MPDNILYLVATPIGNLGDISTRSAQILKAVDFVAAEDTRVTAKLLNHLGIKKTLISYYQHNMFARGDLILQKIEKGESCALCCDAGTPAISDPGELLVREAVERGITVVPIPGPCAAIAALCASGLATGRFCFEGFIPVSKKHRRDRLEAIKDETRTLIFYEAPHKLKNTLADLLEHLGDREITIARELTKMHEEIAKLKLSEACDMYHDRAPIGEFVLVVEGCEPQPVELPHIDKALDMVEEYFRAGAPLGDACKTVSAQTGYKRSELYKLALERRDKK